MRVSEHTYPNGIDPRARIELVAFGERRRQAHDHAATLVEHENRPESKDTFAQFDSVARRGKDSTWHIGVPGGALDLVKVAVHRYTSEHMKKTSISVSMGAMAWCEKHRGVVGLAPGKGVTEKKARMHVQNRAVWIIW